MSSHDTPIQRWLVPVGIAIIVGVILLAQTFGEGAGAPPPASADRLFGELTDTVVFLADDVGTGTRIDLDTGAIERFALPEEPSPGEVAPTLLRVGDRLAVAGSRAWLLEPGGDSVPLGRGRLAPDADPDRLWLLDDTPPGDGQGDDESGSWRLFDQHAELLHEAEAVEGLHPARGIPGGLAVRGEDGIGLYRPDDEAVVDPGVEDDARIVTANAELIVWCAHPCQRLHLSSGEAQLVASLDSDGSEYDMDSTWLSDDGRHLAAVALADDGDGSELHVYDVADQRLLDRTDLSPGAVDGAWTIDSDQFFFRHLIGEPGTDLGRYRVGAGFDRAELPAEVPRSRLTTLPRRAIVWDD